MSNEKQSKEPPVIFAMVKAQPPSLKSLLRRVGPADDKIRTSEPKKSVRFNAITEIKMTWPEETADDYIENSHVQNKAIRLSPSLRWIKAMAKARDKRTHRLIESVEKGHVQWCVAERCLQESNGNPMADGETCHNTLQVLRTRALQHVNDLCNAAFPSESVAPEPLTTGLEDIRLASRRHVQKIFKKAIDDPSDSKNARKPEPVADAENDDDWSEVLAAKQARLASCASIRLVLKVDEEFGALAKCLSRLARLCNPDVTPPTEETLASPTA